MEVTDAEAVDRIEALLSDAVGQRLISDVPLGAFLSGGIDSSIVVALMQKFSARRVQTFSIGFENAEYDESRYARMVAAHIGTEHHEFYLRPQNALDTISTIPLYYDEPFADPSQVPTCILSALTRNHVTVALSGDGGDELMAGYTRYETIDTVSRFTDSIPQFLRALAAGAVRNTPEAFFDWIEPLVPKKYGRSPLRFRARAVAGFIEKNSKERFFRQIVGQWHDPQLLVRGGREPLNDLWEGAMSSRITDVVTRMQFIDTMTYLPDDILVKVDRASMAVGLEVRAPMTDHRLVEFCWQLPRRFKIRGGTQKWLLRELLRRYVPEALFERPKTGFTFPLDDWLRGPLRDWAEDLLDVKRMEDEGLFNPAPIQEKWQQHLSGQADWHYPLWCILMFQAWKRHWIDRPYGAQLKSPA